MNRARTTRSLAWIHLVAGVAVIGLLCSASAWAQTATTTKRHHRRTVTTTTTTVAPLTSEQQRLDQLSGQVSNLQKQSDATTSEVTKIEKEITVAPPASSDQKPVTIGEHVGVAEKNIGDIQKNLSDNLGISVHALVDAGYEHNFNQPVGSNNLIRVFDNGDGFQLTQGNLHIERDGTVGFVTDLNFGQVANTLSNATHYSNTSKVGPQWFDPTQYYLTYTAPLGSGVSLQAGRFVTLLGAETINTYNNQNYNESKGIIFGFGIPFTHTGIRASYTFNDYVALTGGLNNGWDDPADSNNNGPNVEGELTLNNKEKSVSFVLNGIYGPNFFATPPGTGPTSLGHSNTNLGAVDPIATWKPWFLPKLTLQSEYLYASQTGHIANGHSATWQALAGYVVYDWTPSLESATRAEFFQDKDGFRTTPTFNGQLKAQTLWEITQTISYKVPEVTGLLARLEYRHDNSSQNFFTNNDFVTFGPTGQFQHLWHGQDTLSANLIYAF